MTTHLNKAATELPSAESCLSKDASSRVEEVASAPLVSSGKSKPKTNNRLKGTSLKRSIFTLAMGQAGATAIALALSPLLTRVYTPDAFGPVNLLSSLVVMLGVFGTWSYYRALPLTNSLPQRRGLFALSLLIAGIMTVIVAIGVAVFGESFALMFGASELVRFLPFLPLFFLANALGNVVTAGLNCERRFKTVAARTMIQRGGSVTSQILLGLTAFPNSSAGLLLGHLSGTFAGAVWGTRGVLRGLFRGIRYAIKPSVLVALAYKYRRLPCVYTWSNFVSVAGMSAPVWVMAAFYPLSVVGLYGLSYRILKLPAHLFTTASSQVYYVEAADLITQGRSAERPTMALIRILAVLTAFPVVILFLLGPPIFELVFGAPWREAGVYAQILAPWIALTTVGSPLCSLLPAQKRFGEALGYTSSLLIARVGSLVFGGLMFGPRGTLALYTGGNLIVWGALFFRVLTLSQVSRWRAMISLSTVYVCAVISVAPAAVAYWVFRSLPMTGVLAAIGTLVYLACLLDDFSPMRQWINT